jgi:hypothetical protein
MTPRPETPLKDLAATLRTIIRSNKAAAEVLVQIQEIEALAEDRLRPLLPELRVIKDDALTAARELDTTKLGELALRLRDLVAHAGSGHDPRSAPADTTNGSTEASAAEKLAAGHTSYPSDRILPLAAPAADPAAEIDLNSPKRVAEALFHVHELLTAGVLDQAEYDAKKRELLARM